MNIPGRSEKEAQLARAVSEWFAKHRPEYEGYFDPEAPDFSIVPPEFWREMEASGQEAVTPILKDFYIAQAQAMSEEVGVELTWSLVNTNAVNWSQSYGFELIRGLNETTRQQMQKVLSDFWSESATIEDLIGKIAELFGAARAERIAITETTRAAVEGERAYIEGLEAEFGMRARSFWHTVNDSYVCRACQEKDGLEVDRTDVPPLHPGCRCYIDWELSLP